jgi:hypothetical protein
MIRMTIWERITMNKKIWVSVALLICNIQAMAQLSAEDPDWKETEVPPPPSFDVKRLIPIQVTAQSQLKWGIDPSTIVINKKDGVVRYVVVAQSDSGVINAMYEGIRCSKAEFRRYARHNPNIGWVANTSSSDWTPLRESGASRHPQSIAKQGMCDGAAPPTTNADAVRALRAGGNDLVR